jgi:hypothetical protein
VTQAVPPQLQAVMLKVMMKMTDLSELDKKEIVDAVDKMMGTQVPQQPKTPEEAQALQAQMQEAQMQKQMALRDANATLELKEATAAKARAEAQKAMNDAGQNNEAEIQAIEDKYQDMLIQAKQEFDTAVYEIDQRNKTTLEAARIDAEAKIKIAAMTSTDKQLIAQLQNELTQIEQLLGIESQPSDTGKQALAA